MLCTIGCGAKPPVAGEFLRFFVLKVTLHSVTYRKKLGEQDVLLAPPIILLGSSSRVPTTMILDQELIPYRHSSCCYSFFFSLE